MAQAASSLLPTRYWVDVILTTAWECRRFDCEREALAYAQVYARFPNAEAVVAYAYARSLADAWADTTTPHGRLMLTVLGGLAEFERHLILARTSEGRARRKPEG
jgi:Resolvase, N terminal domain